MQSVLARCLHSLPSDARILDWQGPLMSLRALVIPKLTEVVEVVKVIGNAESIILRLYPGGRVFTPEQVRREFAETYYPSLLTKSTIALQLTYSGKAIPLDENCRQIPVASVKVVTDDATGHEPISLMLDLPEEGSPEMHLIMRAREMFLSGMSYASILLKLAKEIDPDLVAEETPSQREQAEWVSRTVSRFFGMILLGPVTDKFD